MNILKITIDHNCIVALDKRSKGDVLTSEDISIANVMDGILNLASQGNIRIVQPAIAASERQQLENAINNFNQFNKRKLAELGIKPEQYSLPEMRLNISFLGCSTAGFDDPAWYVLQREIQQIIHPTMEWDNPSQKNWRNKYCDVMTMFAHLKANADLFVTNDKPAFLKRNKKNKLLQLGANRIGPADQAYQLLLNEAVSKAPPLDMPRFDDSPEKRCIYIPPNSYEYYREYRRKNGLALL